jgi:predicted nucleic acid-binding protein
MPSNAEVVKKEMPACISEELLDEIITYISKEDKTSYMPLLRSGQCIKLSPGMTVSVIHPGFMVSTIRYEGVKLYTLPIAIR